MFFSEKPLFLRQSFFYVVHRMLKLWLLKCFFFNYSVKQNFCMGFLTCNFFEYLHIFCRYYKIIALNKLFSNLTKLFTNASAAFIKYRIEGGGIWRKLQSSEWFSDGFFSQKKYRSGRLLQLLKIKAIYNGYPELSIDFDDLSLKAYIAKKLFEGFVLFPLVTFSFWILKQLIKLT